MLSERPLLAESGHSKLTIEAIPSLVPERLLSTQSGRSLAFHKYVLPGQIDTPIYLVGIRQKHGCVSVCACTLRDNLCHEDVGVRRGRL